MQIRKMRVLRMKHGIMLPELGRMCELTPQRISEIELKAQTQISKETTEKLQNGFARVIESRGKMLEELQSDFEKHRETLMEGVEETTYEL